MLFELARLTKTIECFCLGTIGLIVAPWKFDVLKTNSCPSRANMLVLGASNLQGATIRSIVQRHKRSIVLIVHH